MAATYGFYVDWNGDADFGDSGEDVTGRSLLRRTPLSIRVGRDQARLLAPPAPGEADLELNNASRDYSPENSSSPLAGYILPGRRVYFRGTVGGTDYTLYRGWTDDYTVLPAIGDRSVALSCLDALGRLRNTSVTTELHSGLRTGDAVHLILDAAGWPTDDRDIDPGATVMPWWWLDDADAWDALLDVAASEGPSTLLAVDADGLIVFRDRHHRLTRAGSLTSQATWSDTTTDAEPVYSKADYDHGWKDIVNSVSVQVPIRALSGELVQVWSTSEQITLTDGETITIEAAASSPFRDATTPELDTDYTVLSGTVSVVLGRTSGQSTTIAVTASGGPAVVAGMQLRANALDTVTTRVITAEDTASIGAYGRRSLPSGHAPVWAGVHDAAAIADLILGQRAERLPTLQVTIVGANDTRLGEQLGRNLSDRVTVVNDELPLNADFYIEQIQHNIGEGGKWHTTVFGLEKIPDPITGVFRFDDAGLGFDDGVFGGIGRTDPDTMFRFDVAGQGFDDGMFAT